MINRDEAKTVIILNELGNEPVKVAMPYPPLENRRHYNVGEHRIVRAWADDTSDPEWLCFDHGWECWMTTLANSEGPPA